MALVTARRVTLPSSLLVLEHILLLVAQVGSVSRFLGQATNNEAEYTALILGLTAAHTLGVRRLHVLGDSKLVIEQACIRVSCLSARTPPCWLTR